MKLTLIEIVQDILNEMDSDVVDSIEDTVEAQQVAQIVKSCFLGMVSNRNWEFHKYLGQMDHSGSPEQPTRMKLPENVTKLKYFAYNAAKVSNSSQVQYREVDYMYPDEFVRFLMGRSESAENSQLVIDPSGVKFVVATNKSPSYWTTFDDEWIVCDSYDRGQDDALQASRSQIIAYRMPVWVHLDDAVPDLPPDAFSALLEEAKSTAFFAIKQMVNEKSEAKAQRQQRWLAQEQWRGNGQIPIPNYGRRRRK